MGTTKYLKLLATITLTLSASASSFASGFSECGAATFNGFPQEAVSRKATTYSSATGDIAPTSAAREKAIADRAKLMADEILGENGISQDTPPIQFFPAEGVNAKFLHTNFSGNETSNTLPARIAFTGLGAAGIVKGTLLLPVSGHTGAANAKAWAKTDTYTVKIEVSTDKNGANWPSDSNAEILIPTVKSLDFVTYNEVAIPLQKDHMVRISYYRSGSGGPSGYFEGRVIELVWDGN